MNNSNQIHLTIAATCCQILWRGLLIILVTPLVSLGWLHWKAEYRQLAAL